MSAKYLHVTIAVLIATFARGQFSYGADDDARSKMRVVAHDGGYEFLEGESRILFYQAKPLSQDGKFERAGYVHPLYDLDGNVLSEDFPGDHRHHRGIFWAWHQLYVGDIRIGDPWICRDFLSRVKDVEVHNAGADAVAIRATLHWVSPEWKDSSAELKPIVREETLIQISRTEATRRVIDFRIRLKALEPNVRIGGSDDVKGYGGFSPRLRLPEDIRFVAEYGEVQPEKTAVKASHWMDMAGSFGGTEKDPTARISGVTILCHPSTPGSPPTWILRKARSMQNPVFPGREPVALPVDQPLELRYRMILHRGATSMEQLAAWFDEYAAEE